MAKANITINRKKNEYEQSEDINIKEYNDPSKKLEYFQAIFETAQDSIFIKDKDLRFTLVNPAMEALFDIPRTDLIGHTEEEVFGEEFGNHIVEVDQCVLNGNIIEEEHTKIINGVPKTLHVIKVPLCNNSGNITGLFGIARDITERKNAEKALQELEAKYRSVVDNANEGIVIIQDRLFKFLNPRAVEFLGTSKSILMSRTFLDFVHPEDRDMVLENHIKRIKGEKLPPQYEFRIIDSNGNTKWVQINAVLMDWEGRPAVLNFLSDITERRMMEQEILKADKLESLATLAGGIAHDFNNILTAILGNISLVKMYTSQGDKLYERLVEAEKASLRAKELTQQLLIFSKESSPVVRTTSIAKLLKDSVSFSLSGSNVKCDLLIPDGLYLVDIDESQISHAISNIVINAIQAMPNGGTIRVKAENIEVSDDSKTILNSGKYVKISIEDEGIGIPKENIAKIFDPYFTTKVKSKGLGLTTAYSIIKKHDGYITVESNPNIGTVFNIFLPISSKQIIAKEIVASSKASYRKILVMDDEEPITELLSEALKRIGYNVDTTPDGIKAIELYRQAKELGTPYDAVILDLTVPGGMGGKEAIGKLIEIDPEIKAIVSSGYFNDPVIANFRQYGFKEFVPKPYRIDDICEALNRVLAFD